MGDGRFRVAIEASPAAMVLVDREGKIGFANVKTRELFGYPRRELEGQTVEILVPERFRAGHPAHRARFFAEPRARQMGAGRELFGVRQDGSEFDHAAQGAQHMTQLIEGLLAYSRAGSRGLELTQFPAEKAVVQAAQSLWATIAASRAVLEWDGLPVVEADFELLVEVFQNLIGNAIKFCSERPPRIAISAGSAGADWVFRVRDNGIGIEPVFAERIFGVFQRLHPRERYPGPGIGLPVCRKIIERHGGSIRLGSTDDQGSEFLFTLRRREPTLEA